ncbi:putative C2 domain-containing protein [Phytophthora infestans]|nr:putative C2 domain-containing protein [Phytophthora infestans]
MLTSNDARLESLAYRVQLHNIPQFLPTDNEWNKNYPTIQRIFSPDYPESPVLRQAVMTQHAVIYQHGQERTKYGSVASPADFFELVHNGRRNDKPVLFTYAITSKGWYFSETGAAFFKDMLSKHMLHSGAAFSVKYAGEFHIQQADDDTFKLVIDNNSGTYAPPQEQLPQLQELMENNFPGIICEALDRDDETLMEARKEIFAAWE